VVLNSGAKSERYLKELYPTLPQQAFVQYGNFIGDTLLMADELDFQDVTLGVMLGKAVKLAEGQMDTHSRKGTMNMDFIRQMLSEAQCDADVSGITLARELWDRIPQDQLQDFVRVVISHCSHYCSPLLKRSALTVLLIDDEGHIYE
jgi:cobalt-precorrin-5B (C1)-methyltransferase